MKSDREFDYNVFDHLSQPHFVCAYSDSHDILQV